MIKNHCAAPSVIDIFLNNRLGYPFADAHRLQYLSDLIDLLQKLVYYSFCNFMSYLFNEILNSFRKTECA